MELIDRRTLLKTTAVGAASFMAGSVPVIKSLTEKLQSERVPQFTHRGYLGWITDLATHADTHAAWPSMRLDGRLLDDYRQTFDLMKQIGFNEISIWGLYVSRAWPVDIRSAVTPDRGALVEKL